MDGPLALLLKEHAEEACKAYRADKTQNMQQMQGSLFLVHVPYMGVEQWNCQDAKELRN